MKFSTYSATGWLNFTLANSAPRASSALSSTAYVYPDQGGSGPGMAAGPLGPTVYSVARTVIDDSGCVVPSPRTRVAVVPCWKMSVACRTVLVADNAATGDF